MSTALVPASASIEAVSASVLRLISGALIRVELPCVAYATTCLHRWGRTPTPRRTQLRASNDEAVSASRQPASASRLFRPWQPSMQTCKTVGCSQMQTKSFPSIHPSADAHPPLSSISIMTIAITISVRAKLVRFQGCYGLEDVSASRLPILPGGLIRDELPVSGRPVLGSRLLRPPTLISRRYIPTVLPPSIRRRPSLHRPPHYRWDVHPCIPPPRPSLHRPSSLPASTSPLQSPSSSPSRFHILPHHHSDDVRAQS